MQTLSRRTFTTAIAALSLPAAASASPAVTAAPDEANRLYAAYVALIRAGKALEADCKAALASLPEWARPGPRQLNHKGEFVGEVVSWPRDVDVSPPDHGVLRICRPSQADLAERYEFALRTMPKQAAEHRAGHRLNLRRLAARLREQRDLEARAGLQAKLGALEDHSNDEARVYGQLQTLTPTLNTAAALLLLEASFLPLDASIIDVSLTPLRHMRPQLTGLIGEHVALLSKTIAEDPLASIGSLPLYA